MSKYESRGLVEKALSLSDSLDIAESLSTNKLPSVVPIDLTDPKEEWEELLSSIIPLDREKYKQHQEIFGRRITPSSRRQETKDEEGKAIVAYTTSITGGELTYQFYEDIIRKELGEDATKKLPTLGRRGNRVWYSMIAVAKRQGNGLSGNFTVSELAELWEIDPTKRGRFFADIRETFFNLVAVNPSFTNHRSGDKRIDWGFSFITSYLIKGEGRETRYYYNLTSEALGLTEKWLKGELTIDEIKKAKGYLPYPISYLRDNLPDTEQNLRDWLLTLPEGKSYPVKAYTILKDRCKLRSDLLRRRTYCHGILHTYLGNAKKRGDISSYKVEIRPPLRDWRKKWKVTIYKSRKAAKENRARRNKETTVDQEKLVEEIFEWATRPINQPKGGFEKSLEKVRKQIKNTVRTYGVETVGEIYERTANGAYPSPYQFWQEVKYLKRGRVK